jgi:hypothetical protein
MIQFIYNYSYNNEYWTNIHQIYQNIVIIIQEILIFKDINIWY